MASQYPPVGRRRGNRHAAYPTVADPRTILVSALLMAAMSTLRFFLWAFLVLSALISLYLVKSAMGINLMAGHSPFHDWFYHLVRP